MAIGFVDNSLGLMRLKTGIVSEYKNSLVTRQTRHRQPKSRKRVFRSIQISSIWTNIPTHYLQTHIHTHYQFTQFPRMQFTSTFNNKSGQRTDNNPSGHCCNIQKYFHDNEGHSNGTRTQCATIHFVLSTSAQIQTSSAK